MTAQTLHSPPHPYRLPSQRSSQRPPLHPTHQPYTSTSPDFTSSPTQPTPTAPRGPRIPLSARFHRPGRRRLRIINLAGFPIPALVPKCRCCGRTWPCREVIKTLREAFGWTHKLDPLLLRLRRAVH